MGTIKELLQLVYDYEEKEQCTGLCAVTALLNSNVITLCEKTRLLEYIRENRPENASKEGDWWFAPFDWQPRNEWLLKHINLHDAEKFT